MEPMESVSELRLTNVIPALADRVRQLAARLHHEHNVLLRIVMGTRTCDEQQALYLKGRAPLGQVNAAMAVAKMASITAAENVVVTNAAPGFSWHNFGCAIDVAPSINGFEMAYAPDWDEQHDCWKWMLAAGLDLGLTEGARWTSIHDAPHFQVTGRFPADAPDNEVRKLFAQGGLQAVWAEVAASLDQEQASAPA